MYLDYSLAIMWFIYDMLIAHKKEQLAYTFLLNFIIFYMNVFILFGPAGTYELDHASWHIVSACKSAYLVISDYSNFRGPILPV
jgi:hypothetical protein